MKNKFDDAINSAYKKMITENEDEFYDQMKSKFIGKKVKFSLNTEEFGKISVDDFQVTDEEYAEMENLEGETATITGLEMCGGDDPTDIENGYYDLKFDNGKTLDAIGGAHLTIIE
jgi:hypothetical protein